MAVWDKSIQLVREPEIGAKSAPARAVCGYFPLFCSACIAARFSIDRVASMVVTARARFSSLVSALRSPPDGRGGWCIGAMMGR